MSKREPKFSIDEIRIISDYWYNPNQTLKMLGNKNGCSEKKVGYIITKFFRVSHKNRMDILKNARLK